MNSAIAQAATFIVLASVLGIVAVHLIKRRSSQASTLPPYNPRQLMSGNELGFYNRLCRAFPEFCVFPQVALSALVDTIKQPGEITWRNKISAKVLDFVICIPGTFEVVAVVELDDNTHKRPNRIKADNEKNKALAMSGYVLFRYEVRRMPTPERIRADFNNHK